MDKGFIYILRNGSMPGVLKIGRTARHPSERACELFTTGVPTPFEIVTAIFCDDVGNAESWIHERLADYRVSSSREFFAIEESVAVEVVTAYCLGDWGLSVASDPLVISGEDAQAWADICGVNWHCIITVLRHISNSAWKAAAAEYSDELQKRIARSTSGRST
jgi:hypothetical protein